MPTPMLQTPHPEHPPLGEPSRRAREAREKLVNELERQRIDPEPHETLAVAMIVLVFVGAVLAFSLAATKII